MIHLVVITDTTFYSSSLYFINALRHGSVRFGYGVHTVATGKKLKILGRGDKKKHGKTWSGRKRTENHGEVVSKYSIAAMGKKRTLQQHLARFGAARLSLSCVMFRLCCVALHCL